MTTGQQATYDVPKAELWSAISAMVIKKFKVKTHYFMLTDLIK